MKKCIGVIGFLLLLSVCYGEPKNGNGKVANKDGNSTNKYTVAFQAGFEDYAVYLYGFRVPMYASIIGGNFMYRMSSGLTVSADLDIILGIINTFGVTLSAGLGVNAFLGYTWIFDQKHMLSVLGGIENSLTSQFISLLALGARVSYSYKITEKMGIMTSLTTSLSYNGAKFFGGNDVANDAGGRSFAGIALPRIAIRIGPSYEF